MHRISPDAKTGFNKLDASIAPPPEINIMNCTGNGGHRNKPQKDLGCRPEHDQADALNHYQDNQRNLQESIHLAQQTGLHLDMAIQGIQHQNAGNNAKVSKPDE